MIPDGRDCKMQDTKLTNGTTTNSTVNMNGTKMSINTNRSDQNNKENLQNESNLDDKKKNSLIETEVATELSSELKENKMKDKGEKPPMVYKLVLTGGPCSGNVLLKFIKIY